MASHIVEHIIYGMDDKNIEEKLKPHFAAVMKAIQFFELKNAKIMTRVRELGGKDGIIATQIEEELKDNL